MCLSRAILERMENLGEKEVLMGVWGGVEKNVMGFRCFLSGFSSQNGKKTMGKSSLT